MQEATGNNQNVWTHLLKKSYADSSTHVEFRTLACPSETATHMVYWWIKELGVRWVS